MMLFWRRKNTTPEGNNHPPLVVVVDDEEDLCRLLSLALTQHGYEVATAHDGESGLELIRARRPALVILDIMMPRVNGYQVLARMQQDPGLAPIPVFVMTSLTHEEGESDDQWAQRLGVPSFFSKPIDPDVIVQAVRERIKI